MGKQNFMAAVNLGTMMEDDVEIGSEDQQSFIYDQEQSMTFNSASDQLQIADLNASVQQQPQQLSSSHLLGRQSLKAQTNKMSNLFRYQSQHPVGQFRLDDTNNQTNFHQRPLNTPQQNSQVTPCGYPIQYQLPRQTRYSSVRQSPHFSEPSYEQSIRGKAAGGTNRKHSSSPSASGGSSKQIQNQNSVAPQPMFQQQPVSQLQDKQSKVVSHCGSQPIANSPNIKALEENQGMNDASIEQAFDYTARDGRAFTKQLGYSFRKNEKMEPKITKSEIQPPDYNPRTANFKFKPNISVNQIQLASANSSQGTSPLLPVVPHDLGDRPQKYNSAIYCKELSNSSNPKIERHFDRSSNDQNQGINGLLKRNSQNLLNTLNSNNAVSHSLAVASHQSEKPFNDQNMDQFGQSINGTVQHVPGDSCEALPSNYDEVIPTSLHRNITIETIEEIPNQGNHQSLYNQAIQRSQSAKKYMNRPRRYSNFTQIGQWQSQQVEIGENARLNDPRNSKNDQIQYQESQQHLPFRQQQSFPPYQLEPFESININNRYYKRQAHSFRNRTQSRQMNYGKHRRHNYRKHSSRGHRQPPSDRHRYRYEEHNNLHSEQDYYDEGHHTSYHNYQDRHRDYRRERHWQHKADVESSLRNQKSHGSLNYSPSSYSSHRFIESHSKQVDCNRSHVNVQPNNIQQLNKQVSRSRSREYGGSKRRQSFRERDDKYVNPQMRVNTMVSNLSRRDDSDEFDPQRLYNKKSDHKRYYTSPKKRYDNKPSHQETLKHNASIGSASNHTYKSSTKFPQPRGYMKHHISRSKRSRSRSHSRRQSLSYSRSHSDYYKRSGTSTKRKHASRQETFGSGYGSHRLKCIQSPRQYKNTGTRTQHKHQIHPQKSFKSHYINTPITKTNNQQWRHAATFSDKSKNKLHSAFFQNSSRKQQMISSDSGIESSIRSSRQQDSPTAQHAFGGANSQVDRSKDADHFVWQKDMILTDNHLVGANQYKIIGHLGDGTFGRALKCKQVSDQEQDDEQIYAVKVVRAVQRYTESAKFEAQIMEDLHKQGGSNRGIVFQKEWFMHQSTCPKTHEIFSNMCLVFEPLGKSLYDFIKDNSYKGFEIGQVREMARQSLQAIEFLHSLHLTHTDLKPENILLKSDEKEIITDEKQFPIQVQNKRSIYGSQRCSDIDDSSYFSGQNPGNQNRVRKWHRPVSAEIKLIDFGGATYSHERHTLIINTRQYRAPEVILENKVWDEQSDIWSMACILIELYTGELFFDTDENIEHLAMIEKQCGPIPLHMAQNCNNNQIYNQLHKWGDKEEELYIKRHKQRLRWPAAAQKLTSRQNVRDMHLLDDLINEKWGEQHQLFKDLLKQMLKIDPKVRPTASDCLKHAFFNDSRVKNSKSTEKTQASTDKLVFESPYSKNYVLQQGGEE